MYGYYCHWIQKRISTFVLNKFNYGNSRSPQDAKHVYQISVAEVRILQNWSRCFSINPQSTEREMMPRREKTIDTISFT